nr:hypothetical protein [Novosphingobium flavum]
MPPGFDKPARPAAAAPPRAAAPAAAANPAATPVIQQIPSGLAARSGPVALPSGLPSLEALEAMSPDELDSVLGLKPKDDIPPAARHAMLRVGVIDEGEGGLPWWGLRKQNPDLVRTLLEGDSGHFVSRWGHILVRRALASRLDAPAGMEPADFAAMRAALLVRMGEGSAARALVQDVDTANFSPALTQSALDSYVATSDFTGICPVIALQGTAKKDKPWQVLQAVCDAFSGEDSRSMASLDRLFYYGAMSRIDMLLAQKYAGAAGKARRAVKIEWDGVKDMTPWRYAMTLAVGLQPPAALMKDAAPTYSYMAATAPMLSLDGRASAADVAAGRGLLSSTALVDLYGQVYDEDADNSEWATRAARLRDAYVAQDPADRLAAMREIWGDAADPLRLHSRQVLTAYCAARFPVDKAYADDAPDLISSMLTAGLDANAARWAPVLEKGSAGWALLAVGTPGGAAVDTGAIDEFHDGDQSTDSRRSQFLVAALAGLGRLPLNNANDLAGKYGFRLDYATRWSKAIDLAAQYRNPALVALLAGLGMQGDGWDKMTARNLYHIVAALSRAGLSAEARMIAAEAVARG